MVQIKKSKSSSGRLNKTMLKESTLRPEHTRRQIAATHLCNASQQQISSAGQQNFYENFVAATCCTNSNWFYFVQSVAAINQKYNGRNEFM